MSEIERVYETFDDGNPALWTEREDGDLYLCDEGNRYMIDEEDLETLVTHWRKVWC